MNPRFAILFPLVLTFAVLSAILFLSAISFSAGGINFVVLMVANCLFFLMSLVAFRIQLKAMGNTNPNAFVRSVMAGVMIKMFVCIAAVIGYVLISGVHFNEPAVFISMILYLLYLVVEVAVLMKLNKRKNA